MDRFVTRALLVTILALGLCAAAQAQHGEVGFFGEYIAFSPAGLGGAGIKGLFALNRHLALEGEFSYDFNRTLNETTIDPLTGALGTNKSRMHATNFLGGISVSRPSPKIRPFFTMKMGLMTINPSSLPPGLISTNEQMNQIRASHGNFAIFSAGGVEAYSGKWGFRLDVGDEIYFLNGANSNFRITFGPNYLF